MASETTLNTKNLESLGAARLAELLIELSPGDPTVKRRLRMELTAARGPADLAREVRKRRATIGRSRPLVDWQGIRALVSDLDTQRQAIVGTVAPADPTEALDLLWRFMALAESVFDRCDDSNGAVGAVFRQACDDLGGLARKARPDPRGPADPAFDALDVNGCGQYDGLIEAPRRPLSFSRMRASPPSKPWVAPKRRRGPDGGASSGHCPRTICAHT